MVKKIWDLDYLIKVGTRQEDGKQRCIEDVLIRACGLNSQFS